MFVDIVKEGIESGEFKSDIDPYLVRSVILGTIEHSVISWLLLGRPKDLLALVDPLTDLVVEGVNNKDTMNMKGWNINITLEQPKHVKGSGESSEKNP